MNSYKWYLSKSGKSPFRLEKSAADMDSENPVPRTVHAIYWGIHGTPVLITNVNPEHDILRPMTADEIITYAEIHGPA